MNRSQKSDKSKVVNRLFRARILRNTNKIASRSPVQYPQYITISTPCTRSAIVNATPKKNQRDGATSLRSLLYGPNAQLKVRRRLQFDVYDSLLKQAMSVVATNFPGDAIYNKIPRHLFNETMTYKTGFGKTIDYLDDQSVDQDVNTTPRKRSYASIGSPSSSNQELQVENELGSIHEEEKKIKKM